MSREKYYLAMYDVRGIQKYIFSTPFLKDAIGASAIVEGIIEDALRNAIKNHEKKLSVDLTWYTEEGICTYDEKEYDVQVLYIGGGNAFVVYKGFDLVKTINERMSFYVLQKTYSLQLAIAVVEKTGNYSNDITSVRRAMDVVKRKGTAAKPLAAIPVVKVDPKTGYPLTNGDYSTDAMNKKEACKNKRKNYAEEEKWIDSLLTKKGIDSTVAVVHIDGNNLGLRIRSLMNNITSYKKAVEKQREISYQINMSYKRVFESMVSAISDLAKKSDDMKLKENDEIFFIPVVTAGDDITYVCNGRVAIDSVEYFANQISNCGMTFECTPESPESLAAYGFSVCAGVAFVHSHFPFYIAYDVAEACCENAKEEAKKSKNMQGDRIGNWIDFHICKNVQARNLKEIRKKEYEDSVGNKMLIRPYFIPTEMEEDDDSTFRTIGNGVKSLDTFKKYVNWFQNEKDKDASRFPGVFAKELRNTYPLGAHKIDQFVAFQSSRQHIMPDGTLEMYFVDEDKEKIAKWYDALEMMDLYFDLDKEKNTDVKI